MLPLLPREINMSSQDHEYFRQRAAAERKLSASADRADIASIHEELARKYDALVESGAPKEQRVAEGDWAPKMMSRKARAIELPGARHDRLQKNARLHDEEMKTADDAIDEMVKRSIEKNGP